MTHPIRRLIGAVLCTTPLTSCILLAYWQGGLEAVLTLAGAFAGMVVVSVLTLVGYWLLTTGEG
jgi:hypothetical protein